MPDRREAALGIGGRGDDGFDQRDRQRAGANQRATPKELAAIDAGGDVKKIEFDELIDDSCHGLLIDARN
ncbi:MAG: hypothetical protein J2P17_15500 [Mycobacterium sp.]|nr:hypothetical protein [Mycobacterium sp.]